MYTKLMGEYDSETQAFTTFAGPSGASPYTPPEDGKLVGVRIVISRTAATSLTNGVIVKMTCTAWQPNEIEFVAVGNGLQTAPAFGPAIFDYKLDLPVTSKKDIKLEGKCVDANCVTNTVLVIGTFE